jgi:hypothetical protein
MLWDCSARNAGNGREQQKGHGVQAPTHIVTGILIERTFRHIAQRPLRLMLTGTTALLSHGVLDKLARGTYHPADPQLDSVVWVSYHTTLALLTVILLRRYGMRYTPGILLATLPDIDWLILHSSELLNRQIPGWDTASIHTMLAALIELLPCVRWVEALPDLRHNPWGILVEIGLLAFLLGGLRHGQHRPSMASME